MELGRYVIEALDDVLSWDISEDAIADAVSGQAGLLAGASPDEMGEGEPV